MIGPLDDAVKSDPGISTDSAPAKEKRKNFFILPHSLQFAITACEFGSSEGVILNILQAHHLGSGRHASAYLCPAKIARERGRIRQSVSRAIGKLEDDGVIERVGECHRLVMDPMKWNPSRFHATDRDWVRDATQYIHEVALEEIESTPDDRNTDVAVPHADRNTDVADSATQTLRNPSPPGPPYRKKKLKKLASELAAVVDSEIDHGPEHGGLGPNEETDDPWTPRRLAVIHELLNRLLDPVSAAELYLDCENRFDPWALRAAVIQVHQKIRRKGGVESPAGLVFKIESEYTAGEVYRHVPDLPDPEAPKPAPGATPPPLPVFSPAPLPPADEQHQVSQAMRLFMDRSRLGQRAGTVAPVPVPTN